MPTPDHRQTALLAPPQGELFAATDGTPDGDLATRAGVPDRFVDGVRAELNATLALVRDAAVLPWEDPSKAMLAEMRMRSMSRWLPQEERATLLAAFDGELDRLYGPEDA